MKNRNSEPGTRNSTGTRYSIPGTVLVILILFYTAAYAAEVTPTAQPETGARVLTYEDCYNLAAEKNRDYKIAKLDMAIAEAQLSKAAANFGPSISVMGAYQPILKQSTVTLPAGSFGMGFPPSDVELNLMPANYYSARVSLQQPIFTFGKTFFGYKMAEEGHKIAVINYKKAGEKLKLDVISAFYGALISQEMAKSMEETMKANEEYLRITKVKFKNGQASNFDVLQAQVQYSNTVPEAQRAADGAKLAVQSLKNTLGIPLAEAIVISGSPEYKKLDMAYSEIKKRFDEKSDDREMMEAAVNIAGYGKNLQAAMLLPNIALTLNYSYYSTNRDFNPDKQYWDSSWDGAIGLQWTFYDGFKNVAGLKEAFANEEKAKINRENTENLLEIQLEQLYTSLEQSGKVIEAADEVIKQANEGYRIAKESYKNGLIQSVELLNAETGLLRAKMNYLNAMLNYTTTAEKLKNFID